MLLRDSGICNYNSKCWVSNTGSRFIGFLDTLPWLIWRERYMNCNTWAISVYDWTCNKLSKNLGLWSSKVLFFCDVACLRTTRHIYCVQLCMSWHPLPLSLTICTLTLVFLPLTWYTLAVAQHFKTTSKKKKACKDMMVIFRPSRPGHHRKYVFHSVPPLHSVPGGRQDTGERSRVKS